MSKVAIDPNTECWVWTAARSGRGYASGGGYSAFHFEGRLTSGHRASYVIHRGPIPDGMTIDHLCRNTLCVNPEHLEAVANKVNIQRGAALVTHCPQGHEYTVANTYTRPGTNHRDCRRCRADVVARNRARKKAQR